MNWTTSELTMVLTDKISGRWAILKKYPEGFALRGGTGVQTVFVMEADYTLGRASKVGRLWVEEGITPL